MDLTVRFKRMALAILLLCSTACFAAASLAAPREKNKPDASLSGKTMLISLDLTECKTSSSAASASPESCGGAYRMKYRFRFVGNRIYSDMLDFQRFGDAMMKNDSAANNGDIYILGESFDLLKRNDLPRPSGLDENIHMESVRLSARQKGGVLSLVQDLTYTFKVEALGSSMQSKATSHSTRDIALERGECSVRGWTMSSTTVTTQSSGLMGIVPPGMKTAVRHVLTGSTCAIEG
jgi:hypothetical protein